MNRAASTPNPLSGFERLRHWWERIAASVFPALGGAAADTTASRLTEELRKLLDKRLRQLAREKARSLSEEAMRGLPPVPRGTSARLIREDRDAR